ncbi:uncharacterized protein METZ01_LOCUS273617, partial [marine metagenome]
MTIEQKPRRQRHKDHSANQQDRQRRAPSIQRLLAALLASPECQLETTETSYLQPFHRQLLL